MNKFVRLTLLAATVLCLPILAHAQNGCVNSPENPTALLGLIGAAACAVPALRARLRRNR
jgi:XrtJ-associated TM-motif-TM protein